MSPVSSSAPVHTVRVLALIAGLGPEAAT
jgi:hypothetical protein